MEKVRVIHSISFGSVLNSMGGGAHSKANLGTSHFGNPVCVELKVFSVLRGIYNLFSLLLVAAQLLILRNQFKPEHWLQVPVSIAFGYFIDFGLWVMKVVRPQTYGGAGHILADWVSGVECGCLLK